MAGRLNGEVSFPVTSRVKVCIEGAAHAKALGEGENIDVLQEV